MRKARAAHERPAANANAKAVERHTHVGERAADGARARAAPQPLGETHVAQLQVACTTSDSITQVVNSVTQVT